MNRKILIICIDGMGPDYLDIAPTSNMDQMAKAGVFAIGRSVIPSVTNVNNVSIITGTPPSVHGITSNYYYDPITDTETYMESPQYLQSRTVLQLAKASGGSTALLTSKKKLLRLLDAGADYALAAEDPDPLMASRLGPAPDIYSPEINFWLFKALRELLRERDPDVVYCSTTDYTMHKYAPQDEESMRHIEELDTLLGRILDDQPDREVYVTADHGMCEKTRGIDLKEVLRASGIEGISIPIIKDRYVEHHQNLGGSSYVYLREGTCAEEALEVLAETPGVEAVIRKEEAALKFQLMPDRIGDLFVLAERDSVFGRFETETVEVSVRSHGSRHESTVPIIAYGGNPHHDYAHNYDIVARLEL